MAFEKHRWLLPIEIEGRRSQATLFEESAAGPLRHRVISQRHASPRRLAEYVDQQAMATLAVQRLVMVRTAESAPLLTALFTRAVESLRLAFSSPPSPGAPPVDTAALIGAILGKPWAGSTRPGVVPLETEQVRAGALRALGAAGSNEIYLLGEPPATLPLPALKTLRALTSHRVPEIAYADFHALVQACRWVLTSHGNVPGNDVVCLYSTSDMLSTLERCAALAGVAIELLGSPDAMNAAHGIEPPSLPGPSLLDLLPVTSEGALDAASTNITALGGLAPTLLQELVLDDTAVVDLAPLAQAAVLTSLSLRSVYAETLSPLFNLPLLRALTLGPADGASLAMVARCAHLERLAIHDTALPDLRALAGCAHLRHLTLEDEALERLDGVEALGSLRVLELRSHHQLDTLAPLGALPNLSELRLALPGTCDVRPLRACSELRRLHLAGDVDNQVLELVHPAALGGLERVEALSLQVTSVDSIDWVRSLGALRELDLSVTSVADIRPLSTLAQLQVLRLRDLALTELGSLQGLSNLRELDLSHAQVADLHALAHLTGLEHLDLRGAALDVLTRLAALTRLTWLGLSQTPIARLEGVEAFPRLTHLAADFSKIDDLRGIEALRHLRHLSVSGCAIRDVAPAAGLLELQHLDLSSTRVSDLQPLTGLSRLSHLRLRETLVDDISPLRELGALRALDLSATSVTDLAPLRGLVDLRALTLTLTAPRSLAPLAHLRRLRRLDLGHLQARDLDFSPLLGLPPLAELRMSSHGLRVDLLQQLQTHHRVVIEPT